MAKHQIIYTSCMRGIDGVNDGQQVFSYDRNFSSRGSDDVKALFTYQVPSLPPGVIMSEEIAQTMPQSFIYRRLSNGDAAITLNTYLGRDYMGSAGRFGNHLSHSVVCDFDDLDVYPCELYGGDTLKSSMEFEEVNNPNPPDYLPEAELSRGYAIDTDEIIDFLGIGDNLDYFKQMVVAMLKFPEEKRRIIICDEPENIIKWIAALHYAMPLEIAKKINFSTYDYDPELSLSQICGVIPEGSRYNAANYVSSNRHYVYDFINSEFNLTEETNSLLDFLDTAFSFAYESLENFHQFLLDKTTYRECNMDYCAAYYYYDFSVGTIEDVTEEEFDRILDFSEKYLPEESLSEFTEKLIDESDLIDELDNSFAMKVLGAILKSFDSLDAGRKNHVKQMIVSRLIRSLSTDGIHEDDFIPLYDSLDRMAREVNLSIPAELMVEQNRNSLLSVLEQNIESWKVLFIVRIITEYVNDMHLSADELEPDYPIGKVFFGIVRLMYSTGTSNGEQVIERILSGFKNQPEYFVMMALNIESYLRDIEVSGTEMVYLWDLFINTTLSKDMGFIDSVSEQLLSYNRYDETYQLYKGQIKKCLTLQDTEKFFNAYWEKWFYRYEDYANKYAAEAIERYVNHFESKKGDTPEKDVMTLRKEVFNTASQMAIKEPFVTGLSDKICQSIPLKSFNEEDAGTVQMLAEYQTDVMGNKIGGRLILLWIALNFEKIKSIKKLESTVDDIKAVETKDGATFDEMTEDEVKKYFEWIFDPIKEFSLTAEDLNSIMELFSLLKEDERAFVSYWSKINYKRIKDDKGYDEFAEFIRFISELGNLGYQDMVGEHLCKLNKQKLENLDSKMKDYFKRDLKPRRVWEKIYDVATTTNPLLNNISGLFKKK
ncbi:MAG: hypothetical protein IJH82_10440 [Lachnospiraceae bacterium]|nr:hypothetical protein [Lachnospiraceae bacterium]